LDVWVYSTRPMGRQVFGDPAPEEREKIISDNQKCLFGLLHSDDEECYGKGMEKKAACKEPGGLM
jgi:hypothetical protein